MSDMTEHASDTLVRTNPNVSQADYVEALRQSNAALQGHLESQQKLAHTCRDFSEYAKAMNEKRLSDKEEVHAELEPIVLKAVR